MHVRCNFNARHYILQIFPIPHLSQILESSQSLLHLLKRESSQLKDRSTTEAATSRTKQNPK